MRQSPHNVDSKLLIKVCTAKFGELRINIQNANGKAKPYQVKQVLLAIDKLDNTEIPE